MSGTKLSKAAAFAVAALLLCSQCGRESGAPDDEGRLAPLLENIGELHHPVSTGSAMAQRFFDQGLSLYYGFNHYEADRSFQEAARLDPNLAMAYWGQALALGPNINDPLADPDRLKRAYAAAQKALELKGHASPMEQALVEAAAVRYEAEEPEDRGGLNQAYADAMASVYKRFPDDPDVATLYAESIMDTMPWDYWTSDGKPRPGTEKVVAALETVMRHHPNHPGAHHLYIHAVEASHDPDRAVPSADTLGDLVPVAGHLVHMPSHIYIRVGRYDDAAEANRRAILADEDYIAQCRAQGLYPIGYYPHNIHFLWAALAMSGRGGEAMEVARKVASQHSDEHLHEPGFGFSHLLRATPLFSMVRFGAWDEALAEPAPSGDFPFPRGIWHFARGLAFAAKGDAGSAKKELENLQETAKDPSLKEDDIFGGNTLDRLIAIASEYLAGEIAAKERRFPAAVAHLRKAVELEDALRYSEPPDWALPARHALGAVLLEANRAAEAEKVYREDLDRHRDNGWSLMGLAQALEAQGKTSEANSVRERFDEAWKSADVTLAGSRF
jgi:tetratricopeptide (TPR) repeat protein